MKTNHYDVIVLGAGPGGYPAAIRSAQLGNRVALVEKGSVGGECLNWGCIPSKALISAANKYYNIMNKSSEMGINVEVSGIDFSKLMSWKQSVQNQLIMGIKQLIKANSIDLINGEAIILDANTLKITAESSPTLTFDHLIIATGASFISLPGLAIDEKNILSAKGLLSIESIPDNLVCIGGGIIGLELGIAFAKLGSNVTIIELLPQLMTGVTKRLVQPVRKRMKTLGITIYTNARAENVEIMDQGIKITIDNNGTKEIVNADKILLSVGKKSNTGDLLPEGLLDMNNGFINVNSIQQTSIDNIYAIGDCTGMPFLAHRATRQGIVAAEAIAGLKNTHNQIVPSVIFTDPEIAFVGLSEKEAKTKGHEVIVGRSSFAASGRALVKLEAHGLVRVIVDKISHIILGIEIVGPQASDLISEAALIVGLSLTTGAVSGIIHPHPTLPEMIAEAIDAVEGRAIHVPNARR